MKILVLIKQVPNADSPFRLNGAGTWIDESNLTFGLNDYDRYALEAGLRLKDAGKATEVVALTVGPERAATALRTALATGADRVPLADEPEAPVVLPPHANIRGRAYYTPEEPLCLLTPPSTN